MYADMKQYVAIHLVPVVGGIGANRENPRAFLCVDEAAEGIALASEKYDGSDPVNLGAGFEITIRDLAERLGRLCRYQGHIVWDTSKPNGQPRRCLDVSRAMEHFGFKAKVTFEAGLERTVAWYEAWRARTGHQ